MTAVPTFTADTFPFESTVATLELELVHVTFLFVAFSGATVAVNLSVPPISKDSEVLFNDTPVTDIVLALTVKAQVAFLLPSFVVTVIVAVPAAFAVTTPEDETVETEVLLDDQLTPFSEAFEGRIDAVNVFVSPSVSVNTEGLIDTDSTATYFPFCPSCSTGILTASLPAWIVSIPSRSYPALASDARFTVHSYSEYRRLSIECTESHEGISSTRHLDPLTTTILFVSEASENKSSCVSVVRPVGMISFSCRFVQAGIIANAARVASCVSFLLIVILF